MSVIRIAAAALVIPVSPLLCRAGAAPTFSCEGRTVAAATGAVLESVAMRIKPNKTVLQGKVVRVAPAADGWGADVDIAVESSKAAAGSADFLQAAPGAVVTVFAAEPGAIETGKSYSFTVSVLGGPHGERVVIEKIGPAAR